MTWSNPMYMRWGKLYRGTAAELALEDAIAELGVPYRTQLPGFLYGFRYFPDFILPTLGLVIEVDDPSHNRADKILADNERTEALGAIGFQVARCTNDEALADPRGTVRALLRSVGMWPLPEVRGRVADCLPRVGRCPQKLKREAKSEARQARRTVSPASPPTPPIPFSPPPTARAHQPAAAPTLN